VKLVNGPFQIVAAGAVAGAANQINAVKRAPWISPKVEGGRTFTDEVFRLGESDFIGLHVTKFCFLTIHSFTVGSSWSQTTGSIGFIY
jgi:hypothetical protein